MKSVVGVVVGGLLAFAIACGGSGKAVHSTGGMPPPGPGDAGGLSNPRAELERLDQEITAEMQKLAEPRPAPPVGACAENCAQPMATQANQAKQATQQDATCKPAQTETCTQSCTLKTSICTNASKICSIAADLGGGDAYANEVCNRGVASCVAAEKRCCSCM